MAECLQLTWQKNEGLDLTTTELTDMRLTITDQGGKTVRMFEVSDAVADAIESLLLAVQPQKELELAESWKGAHSVAAADRDIAKARAAELEQLLGEALRLGYLDENKASHSWLKLAKKALGL